LRTIIFILILLHASLGLACDNLPLYEGETISDIKQSISIYNLAWHKKSKNDFSKLINEIAYQIQNKNGILLPPDKEIKKEESTTGNSINIVNILFHDKTKAIITSNNIQDKTFIHRSINDSLFKSLDLSLEHSVSELDCSSNITTASALIYASRFSIGGESKLVDIFSTKNAIIIIRPKLTGYYSYKYDIIFPSKTNNGIILQQYISNNEKYMQSILHWFNENR
jgi:hypothetical protein